MKPLFGVVIDVRVAVFIMALTVLTTGGVLGWRAASLFEDDVEIEERLLHMFGGMGLAFVGLVIVSIVWAPSGLVA